MTDKIDPKVGDRVTIWARVTAVEPDSSGERFYRVKIEGAEYLDAVGLYALRIASIDPSLLAVGDQVRLASDHEESGTIVAIDHGDAWVRWSNIRGGIYAVETLERIP